MEFLNTHNLPILLLTLAVLAVGCLLFMQEISRRRRAKSQSDFEARAQEAFRQIQSELARGNAGSLEALRANREELAQSSALQTQTLAGTLSRQFSLINESIARSRTEQTQSLETIRTAMEKSITGLREENAKKLDEMRGVVDEKLQSTLEKRITESFRLVSERLENVHKSLGEMRSVATNIVDLKRVLTNVKTRGTWGEVQLGNLLESMLAPEQYARNVKPKPRSNEIVEFAIKLPGRDGENGKPVWLPIDSKFPKEDYERLVEAAQNADADTLERASKQLAGTVEKCARDIRDKYIAPDYTTDFAVLFVPTEGLYAEILRRPGLAEKIQREYRVIVSGPTTFAALLTSLQKGFQTLAIQKNSAKIADTLRVVQKEFDTFGELLERVGKKLSEAQSAISQTADRHRIASKKLDPFRQKEESKEISKKSDFALDCEDA